LNACVIAPDTDAAEFEGQLIAIASRPKIPVITTQEPVDLPEVHSLPILEYRPRPRSDSLSSVASSASSASLYSTSIVKVKRRPELKGRRSVGSGLSVHGMGLSFRLDKDEAVDEPIAEGQPDEELD
jgi:hypothetical protein